jgi:hypothetical protein
MNTAKKIIDWGLGGALFALALMPTASAQNQPVMTKPVFLDQGWSDEDRLQYYFTSQGSAAMSYDIFLNLEVANGQEIFRSDKNVGGYGLVPQPPNPKYNPDGLAIGLTKTIIPDGRWKGEWVGMGCALCHNGMLRYKGTRISISGGTNSTLNVLAFIASLDDALNATVTDPKKFDRLAASLGQRDTAGREKLRKRLEADTTAVDGYRNVLAVAPNPVGPGRMDALGLIHNQVQSRWLGVPENWVAPLAPVKPSFVWNLPQSAWAQWSGVLSDPLLRNFGESMGVFARLDLRSTTPREGLFDSTADLKGQIVSENLLRRLAPPKWPEDIFGKIDLEKAAKGAQLHAQLCAGCHSTWPHRWSEPRLEGKRFIENAIVMADVIGTDPAVFRSPQFDFLPTARPGPMGPHLAPPNTGAVLMSPAAMFREIQQAVFNKAVAKLGLNEEERLSAHGYSPFFPDPTEPLPVVGGYKANPHEGMWASPPYLHNGSVPNLYELLLPASQRSKTFFVGSEFDPVKVGVDTSGNSGKFLYDTSLTGNSNTGHSFEDGPRGNGVIGRLLTDDERWALIEYMKTLPNEPRQITPFGGPKDPVLAWQDKTFYHVRRPGTFNGAPPSAAPPPANPR